MTAVHWHIYRMRYGPVTTQAETVTAELDLFFALDRFPTTTQACAALADDIVNQYPDTAPSPWLDQVRTELPNHPEGGVRYDSPTDGPVIWSLADCSGPCRHTMRTTEQHVRQLLTAKIGVSFAN